MKLSVISLAGMIICMATSQVLLKFASIQVLAQTRFIDAYIMNYWIWGWGIFTALGLIFWLVTLKKMPLSAAYPWTAFIYLITPVASIVFFDDVLDFKYVIGMLCIVLGIYITIGGVRKG
jgi:multidrug transporter EmrE-like cation transporter